MTRSRDREPGSPNGEERESGEQLGAEGAPLPADSGALDELEDDELGPTLLAALDAEAGPARALSERELALFADRVERQFLVQRPRAERRLSPKRLLLAGGLFAASAAAAVYVGVVRREAPPASPAGSSVARPAPVLDTPPEAPPEAAVPAPASEEPSGADLPAEPPVEAEPKADEVQAPSSESPETAANAPHRSNRGPRQNGMAAADRLAAANRLRSRHRYREALALYSQVIEIDPSGISASAARVAAAEMKLEQFGDIAGAERLYREAKTQGGELTAEAQFGLAQVARARGDAPAERRALQDFLSRHPESPLVSAARRRLSSLGAR